MFFFLLKTLSFFRFLEKNEKGLFFYLRQKNPFGTRKKALTRSCKKSVFPVCVGKGERRNFDFALFFSFSSTETFLVRVEQKTLKPHTETRSEREKSV